MLRQFQPLPLVGGAAKVMALMTTEAVVAIRVLMECHP